MYGGGGSGYTTCTENAAKLVMCSESVNSYCNTNKLKPTINYDKCGYIRTRPRVLMCMLRLAVIILV